jgi:integrase
MATFKQYSTKDGTKLWEFRVYAGRNPMTGKKQTVHRRGYDTKKAATLAASRITLETSESSRKVAPANLTYRDVFDEWDAGYKNTVRESTYKKNCLFARSSLAAIGDERISRVTTGRIQTLVNLWAQQTDYSYKGRFNVIQRVMRYALRIGYIYNDPTALVVMPRKQDIPDKTPNFWDKTELMQFFAAIDGSRYPQQLAYFRLLAFTGMRRGEAEALTWGDIDEVNSMISITKTKAVATHGQVINPTKTKAGTRAISIDPETLAILRYWKAMQAAVFLSKGIRLNGTEQLLFTNQTNQLLVHGVPDTWLRRFTKLAGMDHSITLHGFRHSHASALFAAGVSLKQVQTRLGHQDAQTTLNVYAHVTKDQGEQATEKLAEYLAF